MTRPSEDDLIATYFAPIAGEGAFGLRDDAAVLGVGPDQDLVVTVDALVAGVHFFPDDPAGSVALKALAVNLSDLAAKGAEPAGFVLALALPDDWMPDWLRAFADGLGAAAHRWACALLGGDTVRTPGPLTISITAFGRVSRGAMVPRTGARPGDHLYVSGTIGDAALGLALRQGKLSADTDFQATNAAFLDDRYLHPQPRTALAPILRAFASGAMDVSDGLVGDAAKMLRASGVSGRINLLAVPLSEPAKAAVETQPDRFKTVMTGGDDYEILAAVPATQAAAFEGAARQAGVSVTRIGEVASGTEPLRLFGQDGAAVDFERGSFSHF